MIRFSSLNPLNREDLAGLDPFTIEEMPEVPKGKMLVGERRTFEGQAGDSTYFRPESLPEMRTVKTMTKSPQFVDWFICDADSPGVVAS